MFKHNDQIGPYTLIRELGRGSFGIVWLAEIRGKLATTQVAIKIPIDPTPDINAIRSEAELWVLANRHPNILSVIEANIHDGHVVIVSEFAPDGSLGDWLKHHGGKAPSEDVAIALLNAILGGLEHLHQLNIIHRDLKPANILLNGQVPLLTDFGLARVLKSSPYTSGAAGTPPYMSPEAFSGMRNPQCDIWSAGVLLHQLLSGQLPFPQTDLYELMDAVRKSAPDPLPAYVNAHLQTVVATALSRDLGVRYQSVKQMRLALNTPPPPPPQPTPVVSPLPQPQPAPQAGPAPGQRFVPPVRVRPVPRPRAPLISRRRFLAAGGVVVLAGVSLVAADFLGSTYQPIILTGHEGLVHCVAWSPDGGLVASCGADKTIRIWDVTSGQLSRTLTGHTAPVNSIAWSPDSQSLCSSGDDGTVLIWVVATGQSKKIAGREAAINAVAWCSDGIWVVSASADNSVNLWNTKNAGSSYRFDNDPGDVKTVAWSPDALRVVSGGADKKLYVYLADAKSNDTMYFQGHTGTVNSVAWSPDGKLIVSGSFDTTVRLWDPNNKGPARMLQGHSQSVNSVAWSPDSRRIASASTDGSIRVWDAVAGTPVQALICGNTATSFPLSVSWSPDKNMVASGHMDGTTRLWQVA